jgi:hypothetical protein
MPACAPTYHTARPAPEKRMPDLDVGAVPPEEGKGQLVLDSTVPTSVREVLSTSSYHGTYVSGFGQESKPICATPCVVNLSYGPHTLEFVKGYLETETVTVNVTTKPTVYRVAPGKLQTHVGGMVTGIMLLSLGLSIGLTCLGVGAGLGNSTLVGVGVGGVAVGGVGAYLMHTSRNEITPGASVSFPVP